MKRLAAAAILFAASPVLAHPRLTEASPAANASVKTPGLVRLHFSEVLEPAFSGALLKDAGGKTIPASAAVGGTAITLVAPVLRPGAYTVEWHGVGRDSHRVNGRFTFHVIP